jgi:hypothetical protein
VSFEVSCADATAAQSKIEIEANIISTEMNLIVLDFTLLYHAASYSITKADFHGST